MDEDEPCDSEEEVEESEEDEEEEDAYTSEDEENVDICENNKSIQEILSKPISCSFEEFISYPTSDRFLGLGEHRADLILSETKVNKYIYIFLKCCISIIQIMNIKC